ncbi:peptidase family S66 [Lipomyces tetrasporus]|uniref:Peptidase family S66 n=1 Tax=Lipomyces tetrasporus TaxID=54092 RepID=A0AAD7QX44_9ASCO|nr:peptidase family S66 [Lipomyces tetrasporus]KAJ8103034.1 peptidase family S66 [Lipomyces tetrasporus]
MPPSLSCCQTRLRPGSRVAIVSPSFGAPGLFPHVHELAMQRLEHELQLIPVEYPTTRQIGATPRERAADLNAAFADTSIQAIMATIGGDDQITVLPFLDSEVISRNPKPFFGYSDNTNLLNYLWNLGMSSYHGGSTMVHLARPGGLHPLSTSSLRAALFGGGDFELHPVDVFNEDELDWSDATFSDPNAVHVPPLVQPSTGFYWHQPNRVISGPSWGGNLEILDWNLSASRWIRTDVTDYAGCVLLLETSEEMPSARYVFRTLRNAGERGLLAQFPAVVVARPKSSNGVVQPPLEQRIQYRQEQREAILKAFAHYNPDAMIVFDVDFGHTDPQWILPYGGVITVNGPQRRIVAHFG